MDRVGPDKSARKDAVDQVSDASFATDTSARVAAILVKAEARAKAVRAQSERSASDTRRTARREADQIGDDARRAAEAAARARVGRISELRASIAARAGSLVEGLEGGELTAARLEELVEALGEAADRILAEIGASDSRGARAEAPARLPEETVGQSDGEADEHDGREPLQIADPIPEGAPIARRPGRSTARAAAVLMAIQGIDRDEVARRLAHEHGLAESDELLDDVFGRADAPA
jgi:hypothetical protein